MQGASYRASCEYLGKSFYFKIPVHQDRVYQQLLVSLALAFLVLYSPYRRLQLSQVWNNGFKSCQFGSNDSVRIFCTKPCHFSHAYTLFESSVNLEAVQSLHQ